MIFWRTALDDIRKIDLASREPHRRDHLIEFLASAADEWPALLILALVGRLADEDQLSVGWAFAKHQVSVRGRVVAMRAQTGVHLFECRELVGAT